MAPITFANAGPINPAASVAVPSPSLIQHTASTSNPIGISASGDNFQFSMPNAVGMGNCLILGIHYPHGSTPTITDNNGNTWPGSPTAIADSGPGNFVNAIFVLPNANAGVTKITVALGGAVNDFQYTASEFNNIATITPVNGTSSAVATAPSLSTGSFTPTINNDVSGGNLIWSYFALGSGSRTNPSSWTAGGSFTLLDGDIAWVNNDGIPHASQYFVQATQAAINPSITAAGSTSGYNGASVALKVASAGTPAPVGIHINKMIFFTADGAVSTFKLQIPATGNLRVLLTAFPPNFLVASGITDSDGNNDWVHVNLANDQGQAWYSPNHGVSKTLTVTFTFSLGSSGCSFAFYDISGAAASPANGSAGASSTSIPNVTSFNDQPILTPTSNVNGVAVAVTGTFGSGPITGNTSPSGGIYDSVNYTGLNNTDLLNNGDGYAHAYYSTNTTEHWDWTCISAANNAVSSLAVAFK